MAFLRGSSTTGQRGSSHDPRYMAFALRIAIVTAVIVSPAIVRLTLRQRSPSSGPDIDHQ